MENREIEGMPINPSASAKVLTDTPIEWYDFGGGTLVATTAPETKYKDGYTVALTCIRKGLYYFKVFELEGLPTEDELSSMFKIMLQHLLRK